MRFKMTFKKVKAANQITKTSTLGSNLIKAPALASNPYTYSLLQFCVLLLEGF